MSLTRRQKEIYEYVRSFLEREGYAPSLEEIAAHFGLSSVATVHKHIENLVEKGLLRKLWNRSRSLELVERTRDPVRIPMLGRVAAGLPIEAVAVDDSIAVPADLIGNRNCFALQVQGESMVDDHILDGDVVVLEGRTQPRNGETVVALVGGDEATLKRFYLDGGKVRLVPAHPTLRPMEFPAEEVQVQGVVIGLIRRY
ncbi:MAG: transcriptional repressor LexA [Myxococcota bacterium]